MMTQEDADKLVQSMDGESFLRLKTAVERRRLAEERAFELTTEEAAMLRAGNKIDAVKSVRWRLRIELRQAKDLVDRWSGAVTT